MGQALGFHFTPGFVKTVLEHQGIHASEAELRAAVKVLTRLRPNVAPRAKGSA